MKYLSRFAALAACCALALVAEDFWLNKPYTDWDGKQAAKLLQNSPWARQVSVSMGDRSQSMESGGGGRGRGRGGGEMGSVSGMGDASGGAMDTPNMNGPNSGGRRGGGGGGGGGESLGGTASILVTVRWQSALPVRQASIIAKLGREKATSEEANKFLKQVLPGYVVGIIGLPGGMARMSSERLDEVAKTATMLRIKDKDPIAAVRAQAVSREKFVDLYFVFPKTAPIVLEDKEVEFVMNLGSLELKRKFKLKDMVAGDKLEL